MSPEDRIKYENARQISIHIIDVFETLLNDKNITIPSVDREGGSAEARIFGMEYFDLEHNITDIILQELRERNR
jgi:hypothetical protein